MLQNNNEYLHGPPDTNFFYGAQKPKRDRSPTSISGAVTDFDAVSERNNGQPLNNLLNQSRGSFTGSHVTKLTSVAEQKKKYVEAWGVQSEESKKIIEARYLKLAKLKSKKKVLNADERFKKFKNNASKY